MSPFHTPLIFLFFLSPAVFSAGICSGEEKLDPSGKYCYIVHTGQKSFHDAEKSCYDYGYQLATVKNMIDNNFLYNYSRHSNTYSNYFWLGLTDLTSDGSWAWVDGSSLDFMYWSQVSTNGYCGAMRSSDGKWQAQDCSMTYPFFCYARAQGAPTDPPSTPKTTTIHLKRKEVMMKFMADSESLGDPNTDQNALKFYNNEREFIKAVTDSLFANPQNGNNLCKFYMQPAFYGYTQYEQEFDYSPAWDQREFDSLLEGNRWDDGKTDHAYNITDAIIGAQHYRWTPQMEDLGYTVLVFLTARQDFTGVPSLFSPFPKFDQVVVVSLNGSKMGVPAGVNNVNVSNDFNNNDIQNLLSVLKCH